jgi:glyoxylase-like metal-dependent hydrolase (beta-lactamase superfamily II)
VRVAERWFDVEQVDEGVLRITEPHALPLIRANLYLIRGRDRDVMVDSGLGIASLRSELADLFERPVVALATHRHFDHIGGLHEFDEILAHRNDADEIARPSDFGSLQLSDYDQAFVESSLASGYELADVLIDALPYSGFDPAAYRVVGVRPTRLVEEGDVIDLGERRLEVLHLPGHTPGEIGFWEPGTATLFSGDCVYESGDLLDDLPESDISDYVRSMERLRDLPVRVVYGGHDAAFDRERLLELIDDYVRRRGPGAR